MEAQTVSRTGCQVLNRDVIKYIAMFTMLFNHIAHVLLTRGTPLYLVFEEIGYFTAPVMCFFLVEGYQYTRSKVKYGGRLFFFAVLSQLPYHLAFHYGNLNMFFTLFCCFLILVVLERVDSYLLQIALCFLLILVTAISDWALVAPILTLLLAKNWGEKGRMWASYVGIAVVFAMLNLQSNMMQNRMNGLEVSLTVRAVCDTICSGIVVLTAGAAVLIFYNGERAKRGKNFSKWFFYFFYPVHLFVLYLIRLGLHNVN